MKLCQLQAKSGQLRPTFGSFLSAFCLHCSDLISVCSDVCLLLGCYLISFSLSLFFYFLLLGLRLSHLKFGCNNVFSFLYLALISSEQLKLL